MRGELEVFFREVFFLLKAIDGAECLESGSEEWGE